MEITYERSSGKMLLVHGDDHQEMPSNDEVVKRLDSPPLGFAVVHADDQVTSTEDLIRALDASDPIIRQNAQRALILRGPAALPLLENTLTDPSSSERLRIEVLSTLNRTNGLNVQLLSDAAACGILKEASDPSSPILRREAALLVSKGV